MTDIEREHFITNAICLIAILAIIFGMMLAALVQVEINCREQTATLDFPWKYEVFSGCMIEVEPGLWIHLSNFHYIHVIDDKGG